jgi:hypothetical protein
MMGAPDRSREQRRVALENANAIRARHAEVKRLVRDGYLGVEEVIEQPTADAETLTVLRLLLSAPGWGPVSVERVMRDAGVPVVRRVGSLNDRERRRLLEELALGPRTQGAAAHLSPPR